MFKSYILIVLIFIRFMPNIFPKFIYILLLPEAPTLSKGFNEEAPGNLFPKT